MNPMNDDWIMRWWYRERAITPRELLESLPGLTPLPATLELCEGCGGAIGDEQHWMRVTFDPVTREPLKATWHVACSPQSVPTLRTTDAS